MGRILVTYATMAGSTAEVAQAVGEEIGKSGALVEVRPLGEVKGLDGYDGVVVGAPMIMGWHRGAQRFLKKHRKTFQQVPLAVFILAMRLTKTDEMGGEGVEPGSEGRFFAHLTKEVQGAQNDRMGVRVRVDEKLAKPPEKPGRLNFKERYASLPNYLKPILQAVRPAKPVSIGVFGGRMEYGRLKWWAVLFAMVVVQAPAGEKRNWEAIREWAGEISKQWSVNSE